MYIVAKSKPLNGTVKIEGAKNASLPILAASLLVEGTTALDNLSPMDDVLAMTELLSQLGARVNWDDRSNVTIDASADLKTIATYDQVKKIRASNLLLGALLARRGRAKISMPGGCDIGNRPMDLHLKGFAALGAEITVEHGYIEVEAPHGLKGASVYLDFPSVGATENIMLAAAGATGQTVIENAAREPEVVDLANFLNAAGVKVRGAGTDLIRIEGATHLQAVRYSVIPDRIEAGTFMIAAAITGGTVTVENVIIQHLQPLIAKLRETGAEVMEEEGRLTVQGGAINPIDLKTLPHPGFPTDLQSPMMALLTRARGTSVIVENIFENRLQAAEEFRRMGAQIKVEGQTAVILGVEQLFGCQVVATDLRAGAGLVLAGLVAEGETAVLRDDRIDRGYYRFAEKLVSLGASIHQEEGADKP